MKRGTGKRCIISRFPEINVEDFLKRGIVLNKFMPPSSSLVRTRASQACNTGSNPVGGMILVYVYGAKRHKY